MANLPPDTITEILSRLPVKSLLRFRCVSKPWCATIDGPDFVKLHLKQSMKNNSGLSLILGGMGKLYNLDFHKLDKLVEIKVPVGKHSELGHVLGSCNGLLLLQMEECVVLYNPATRKLRTLPSTPRGEPPKPEIVNAMETFSLGFDSVNDDYKVLRLFEFRDKNENWVCTEAKIYSLKSNSWKKVRDFPFPVPPRRAWAMHLNGVLHTFGGDRKLLAYDLVTEKSYQIPLPRFDDSYCFLDLDVFDGCLCVTPLYNEFRADMWVMKEYRVRSSWVMLLSIAPPLVKPFASVNPLAYSNDGQQALLNYDEKDLIWYDLKKKKVRRSKFRGLPHTFYVEPCVSSLVPVDVKGKVTEKKKEVQIEKPKEARKTKKRDDFLSKGFKLVL